MRILMVSKYYPPVWGGVESNAYYISTNLAKAGHQVTVLCSTFGKEAPKTEKIKGVEVVRLRPQLYVGHVPVNEGLYREILRRDFDILHLHEPNPFNNLKAYVCSLIKRKPYVITYHSDIETYSFLIKALYPFYRLLAKYLLLRRAKVIMPTSPQYIELSDLLPYFKKKCVVVPNGVDLKVYRPKPKKRKQRKTILFVGRLIYYKGLDYLLKAFASLAKDMKNVDLVLVGDGNLKDHLNKLVHSYGIERRVHFKSNLSNAEMIKEYQNADVFVLPSIHKTEAFGIVMLEAMACGTPVIGTDVSGTAYVLENAGIAVKPRDVGALEEAIRNVLTSEHLQKEMTKRGLEKAKQFSWEKNAKKVESVYRRALR